MSSVFTKIIQGEIPCYKIYEDDHTMAFLDNDPKCKYHTLVVPKVEIDKIYDLPDDKYQHLMASVKKLARHIEAVTGRRTIIEVVGTDVPHAHVHLTPHQENYVYGQHVSFTPEEYEAIRDELALE